MTLTNSQVVDYCTNGLPCYECEGGRIYYVVAGTRLLGSCNSCDVEDELEWLSDGSSSEEQS